MRYNVFDPPGMESPSMAGKQYLLTVDEAYNKYRRKYLFVDVLYSLYNNAVNTPEHCRIVQWFVVSSL